MIRCCLARPCLTFARIGRPSNALSTPNTTKPPGIGGTYAVFFLQESGQMQLAGHCYRYGP